MFSKYFVVYKTFKLQCLVDLVDFLELSIFDDLVDFLELSIFINACLHVKRWLERCVKKMTSHRIKVV